MTALNWSASHAVFVTEIDDEHKEIFEVLSALQAALGRRLPQPRIAELTSQLVTAIQGHFAHEERLMRASRYSSFRWHRDLHASALRHAGEFLVDLEAGHYPAGVALVDYLFSWLDFHTRLADRMLGSFLRNRRRVGKITFQVATKPPDACEWVDVNGRPFEPKTTNTL